MSNEILTKLMDPLEKGPIDLLSIVRTDEFGNGSLREQELCTWAAKWYLDSYLDDWTKYEDCGNTTEELADIFEDEGIANAFITNQMDDCINLLEATGIGGYYERIKADATQPFINIVRGELERFLAVKVELVLTKIQEIYAARTEKAFLEADQEKREYKSKIPEDLKNLRDPLNTESIDFFALLPTPVYGATTDVTQDDFIAWFAKNHVKKGRCTDGLSDAFQGICPWFHSSCIKLLCLIGYDGGKEESTLGVQYVTKAALKEFYENNNSKIISKVKEIMKLWLEHGFI